MACIGRVELGGDLSPQLLDCCLASSQVVLYCGNAGDSNKGVVKRFSMTLKYEGDIQGDERLLPGMEQLMIGLSRAAFTNVSFTDAGTVAVASGAVR